MSIDKIFDDSESIPLKALIFSGLLWVVLFIGYRLTAVDYNLDQAVTGLAGDVEFITQTSLALVTSVFAGMLFAYFYKARESGKLQALRSLALPEFTSEILKDVAHYRGIYCEDHQVEVKLKKHKNREDLLMCELIYSYHKSKINKEVKATFYRITDDTNPESLPLIADECLTNEFVWFNDERDMDIAAPPSDYTVTDLCIGDVKLNLTREEDNNGKITFVTKLSQEPDELSFITYKTSFPVERESVITVTAEFPSRRGSISLDYTDIADDTTVTVLPKTGIKSNPVAINQDKGFLRLRHNGWMLPKDGYTFCWWQIKQ